MPDRCRRWSGGAWLDAATGVLQAAHLCPKPPKFRVVELNVDLRRAALAMREVRRAEIGLGHLFEAGQEHKAASLGRHDSEKAFESGDVDARPQPHQLVRAKEIGCHTVTAARDA